MGNDVDIVKFIRKALKSGYPAGELKNDLLNKGYTSDEIEAVFLSLSSATAQTKEQKAGKQNKIHILSIVGISLFICGIATKSTTLWLNEYSTLLLISGVICFCVGYFISSGKGPGKSSL